MADDTYVSTGIDLGKFKLPLLTTTNYYIWSRKMGLVLRSKGLWGIVNGNEKKPTVAAEIPKFEQRSDIALSTILLLVHDSYVAPVMDMTDPKTVWDTLKSQYQSVSEANRDALLEKYQSTKMKPNEKVLEFRARLSEIEAQLTGVGYATSDAEKLRTLLRGLRSEFSVTAEIIRGMDKSMTDGLALLISKEATLSQSEASPVHTGTALNTVGNGHTGNNGNTGGTEAAKFNAITARSMDIRNSSAIKIQKARITVETRPRIIIIIPTKTQIRTKISMEQQTNRWHLFQKFSSPVKCLCRIERQSGT